MTKASSDGDHGIVRGEGGKFIKTAGRRHGSKHATRMALASRPVTYADIAADVLNKASEKHLKEIVENIAEQGKTDASIGLNFAKLVSPSVQRRFLPAGCEWYETVPFVDRPEALVRMLVTRQIDVDGANTLMALHKGQVDVGFTRVLRQALDLYASGELDMQTMLLNLGAALEQHESIVIEGEKK